MLGRKSARQGFAGSGRGWDFTECARKAMEGFKQSGDLSSFKHFKDPCG